ncbi:hypothetical protein GGF41_002017 [Coemansia sp. RSA 2531]|nr:hypothetical protein GGF41_002017 [Coemansia sp. RSA 2531]
MNKASNISGFQYTVAGSVAAEQYPGCKNITSSYFVTKAKYFMYSDGNTISTSDTENNIVLVVFSTKTRFDSIETKLECNAENIYLFYLSVAQQCTEAAKGISIRTAINPLNNLVDNASVEVEEFEAEQRRKLAGGDTYDL